MRDYKDVVYFLSVYLFTFFPQKALSICEKIYGGVPTVLTAMAHQALARALVVNQQFADEEYYNHAFEAYLMAQDCIPGDHPKICSLQIQSWQVHATFTGSYVCQLGNWSNLY